MLRVVRENMFWATLRVALRLCPLAERDHFLAYLGEALAIEAALDTQRRET